MGCLWLHSLLLLSLMRGKDRGFTYTNYRLEKLCPPDGSKARLRLSNTAASFHLNSSLVPGHHFSCHIELSVDPANSGILVYFDSMKLAEPTSGECKTDYVQFGRDFLFITSHRSNKFCGSIERRLPPSPPSTNNRSLGRAAGREGEGSGAPPLSRRVYTEESDQEMDLWLQLAVPALDWPGHKTVSLTVTPFRKSCSPTDRSYRRCSITERHCIRRELFCDGQVNCVGESKGRAHDETDCKVTTQPPISDSGLWEDAGFLHFAGVFFVVLFLTVLLIYISKTYQQKKLKSSTANQMTRRYENSLIDLEYDHSLIVPVGGRARRPAPPLPPPYSPVERDPPYAPHYNTNTVTEKTDTAEDTATPLAPAPKYSYINS